MDHDKAFTLVELLIVITVISILGMVVMTNYMSSLSRARDGAAIDDIKSIQKALEMYYSIYAAYPASLTTTNFNSTTFFQNGSVPKDLKTGSYYNYDNTGYCLCSLPLEKITGNAYVNTSVGFTCGAINFNNTNKTHFCALRSQ